MSKELPALRPREVVRFLEKAGFVAWRQKGSHLTLYRASDRRALTVPIHFSKTVPKGTLHAIIKQAGLTIEEFLNLGR
jgi:predicted RNA binding protein YcfA (HicA-like mRNA interferase family)